MNVNRKMDAAVDTTQSVAQTEEGIEILRTWLHGDSAVILNDWPRCATGVFAGSVSSSAAKDEVKNA